MDHDLMQTIRHNLQRQMDECGVNAAELARRSRLNPTAVYDILKGKIRNPRVDTIEKVAAALGVSPLTLMQEENDRKAQEAMMRVFLALPSVEQDRLLTTAQAWLGSAQAK